MTQASKVLGIAAGQIGTREQPPNSNNVKYNTAYYGREISGSAYAWCCAFQWWLFREAGLSPLFYGGGKTASCTVLYNYYRKQGQAVPAAEARPGDLVFFVFDGNQEGILNHIGVCESCGGGYITTIDGNTEDGNEANGGCVMRRKRALKYVGGVARPNYEEDDDMTEEQVRRIVQAATDAANPLFTSLDQVPEYWRADTKALMDAGAIQGDGTHSLNIRRDQLQAVIICKRYADKK